MKKIISKILIICIIIAILFEFTGSSNVCYAFDSEDINSITNLIGGLVSFILWIPRLLVTGMAWLIGDLMTTSVAESCGISDATIFKDTAGDCATPFDIFFGKYKFFDVNFFEITNEDNLINTVRTQVAQWFYVFRTIASAILLVILIYVGIRMAISTIAEDKAKYKKMLFDWCCSLALIFVLQYIAIFTIEANNVIVNFLRDYGYNDIDKAIQDIMNQAMGPMGIGALVSTFVYCMIIFQTIAFMITYIQRMLKVAFLIIISPLISLTYSIDKMGDGKAQALNKWLKEFVYTILIQPFHCIMYLAFVNTAMKLLGTEQITYTEGIGALFSSLADGKFNQLTNGFLAILCLKFINDGEKAIRKIFNFQDDSSMTSLAAGAAVGMAAISSAKKIGSTTAKGINMAKSLPTKFGNAIKKDGENGVLGKALNPLKDTKVGNIASKIGNKAGDIAGAAGKKVGKITNAIGSKANKIGNAIVKSPAGQIGKGAIEKGKFIGKKIDGYKTNVKEFKDNHEGLMQKINGAKTLGVNAVKRSMPVALGMMGAAMSYATGSSGAMEAIGVGSALNKGSEEFFASSQGTLESGAGESLEEDVKKDEEVQKAQENLNKNKEKLAETSRNLSATNDNISQMTEHQQAMGGQYMDLLKNQDDLSARKAALRDSDPNYAQELAKIEKEQKSLQREKESLERDTDFGKVARTFEHKYQLEKDLSNQVDDQKALEAQLKKVKAEAADRIIEEYSQNGSDSLIAKARTDISKAVQKCMMEKKAKEQNGDISADYTLSDKETRSAERMQESICALLDKTIVSGGGSMDSGEVFKQYFGDDSDSPMAKELKSAIDDYQFQARAKNYNDNESRYTSLGGEKDKFRKDVSKKAARHG